MPSCDRLLYSFCHHRPDRLLDMFGGQTVLCARCSGIYLGFLAAFFIFFVVRRRSFPSLTLKELILPALLVAVMPLEVLLEVSLGWNPGNFVRYLTGIGLGTGFSVLLAALWRHYFDIANVPKESGNGIFAPLLASLAAGAALAISLAFPIVMNFLVFTGLFLAYFLVNMLVARGVMGVRSHLISGVIAVVLTFIEWEMLYLTNNFVLHSAG